MSPAPGAFYAVFSGDFGELPPAAPVLAYNAGAGSLAAGNAFIKITWITTEGESNASAEATVAVGGSSGAVTITQPTVPTNGATVIGWRVYSSGTTGTEKLNTAANSTTQAQVPLATEEGVLVGFPIATTAVQVLIYGTGAVVPTFDESGIQAPMPLIAANSTAVYDFRVPNSGSQWKVQKTVDYMRPDGTQETAGIVIAKMDCIQPLYPGLSAVVAVGTYFVMNGYLWKATVSGTTAATFIGFSAFNKIYGTNTIDGGVTWTSFAKACLVRVVFGNVSVTAATPVAQSYELFES
jgi:hypothetical protein